jgi:hypothetical protein
MKKCISKSLLALILTAILFSCKKDNPKNYNASIAEKTWWGMLAYSGKTPEYYSILFNADNTLTWSEFAGNSPGHWVLDGKRLTITFDGKSIEIKADISDNDQLVNITDNISAFDINSGELIGNTNINLDNTVWTGTIDYPSTKALQLSFKPGLQVTVNIENSPVKTYTYIRSSSNGVIRVSTIFFGIVISGSKMKGSTDVSTYIWQVTKQ